MPGGSSFDGLAVDVTDRFNAERFAADDGNMGSVGCITTALDTTPARIPPCAAGSRGDRRHHADRRALPDGGARLCRRTVEMRRGLSRTRPPP